jgi:hypothetical protein
MAENRKSSGRLVTLSYCTALSNIPAGTPVACLTGNNVITTLGRTVTGMSATAGLGHHFIGILDANVSAGQSPISVWTEGVFELTASSAWTTAYIGDAVFPDSGKVCIQAAAAVTTGDSPIGSYIPYGTGERSGTTILVRINPMIWRHNTFGHVANSTSGIQGGAIPRNV